MSKKILIYLSKFSIGGAEKSTIKLCNELASLDYKVTVLNRVSSGDLSYKLNKKVKTISIFKRDVSSTIDKIFYLNFKGLATLFIANFDIFATQRVNFPTFLKLFPVKKKVCWIRHTVTKESSINLKKNLKYFDRFICVSNASANSFNNFFKEYKEKSRVLYNFLGKQEIKNLSLENKPTELDNKSNKLNLVTVSRLSAHTKQFDLIIDSAKLLLEKEIDFAWFILGDGEYRKKLEQKIIDSKLSNFVFLLGKKINPYPYFKYSDLVVHLSSHEGLCGVINEAKVLGKAVLASNIPSIREQITHKKNGYLTDNIASDVFKSLYEIINTKSILKTISNNYLPDEIIDDQRKRSKLQAILNEVMNEK